MAPIDYLKKLVGLSKEEKRPAFSPWYAAGLSILLTLIYIVPFYLSAATRPSPSLSRDAPSSIRARIRAVTLSTTLSSVLAIYLIQYYTHSTLLESFALLGWFPISLSSALRTLLLTASLFAGPLFENGIVDGGWKHWVRGRSMIETLTSWVGIRNYIAGPASEELIWRSIIIPIHILAHVPAGRIIWVTPLYFGIAHVHHYYEFRLTNPNTPALPAVLRSLFQFTYTSLFGFYAAFVFLRTRDVLGLVLAHSFCNWMGLPRFWGRVGEDTTAVGVGPPGEERDRNGGLPRRQPKKEVDKTLGLTVTYYTILVSGVILFGHLLFPLTESDRALATFE